MDFNNTISIIIPIFNEEESIRPLFDRLQSAVEELPYQVEFIAVNDGSVDQSQKELAKLAGEISRLKTIELRKNSGQTAALMAGIDNSTGDIIITIDSDLQNDPGDIPKLLEKLEEGYDVVSGWRKDRKDAAIKRNFVSNVANKLVSWISGVHLKDFGCSLKAYRRDVLTGNRLYGEMHRFIPIYASWMGAKVIEIPVQHHARQFGSSKYGLERTLKVILDLIVIKFLEKYLVKPIYFFGGFAVFSFLLSILSFVFMIYFKLFQGTSFIETPLPVLAVMFALISVISLFIGILAEIMMRTYFESQDRKAYAIKSFLNFEKVG